MKLLRIITALTLVISVCGIFTACSQEPAGTDLPALSRGLDENGFFEGVKASDYVILPKYKGIDIDKGLPVADEDEIREQIDGILANYAYYEQITDRAIVSGDTVNIDYIGYVDGVQFDGGNTGGLGTTVTVGVDNYVEGFLDQLIGRKAGDEFDINVRFPDDYGMESLNGKQAVFKTTVNYIRGEYIVPEFTDEIAVECGAANTEELVADIEDWIVSSARFYFFTDLLEEAVCEELPDAALNYIIEIDLLQYDYYASVLGMSVEDYIVNYLGYESLEAYTEANAEKYRHDTVLYLAAQAIAELEKITVTDKQIEEAGYTEYIAEYGKPYLKQFMLFQEILPGFIVENGNLVDMPKTSE